jgi:hypothetical protein
MNHVERFKKLMNFEPVDRLPKIEWASWWDKTLERWHGEGLPEAMIDHAEIRSHLNLDPYFQVWMSPCKDTCPEPDRHGAGLIANHEDYLHLRHHLFPHEPFDNKTVTSWEEAHRKGEAVIWFTLEGFFWFPRTLLGIEPHLYAFADQPELLHRINQDLLEYNLKVMKALCNLCSPDFMTFAEDMSYNHGPMISRAHFDAFIAPCYREIVPEIRARGIIPMIDSDGDVTELIPWLEDAGIEGILPLERMAGVDVSRIRKKHPRFKMIGAFDKTKMRRGEDAIRQEFERLLPVMKQGGFIPSVDHQTPPDVSLSQYSGYLSLLEEYCRKAVD